MARSKRIGTLVPTDPNLEKTTRQLKNQKKKKKQSSNQGKPKEGPSKSIMPPKSSKSYGVPSPSGISTGPTIPTIEAINFEIKPAFITMIQYNKFRGHPSEDPANHLQRFQQLCRTVKYQGVTPALLKVVVFKFLLKDKA